MKKITLHLRSSLHPGRLLLGWVTLLFLMTPLVGIAGNGVTLEREDPRLVLVHALLHEAAYDSALVVLHSLTADEALASEDRQESYRLLGLIHTVLGDEAAARKAIRRLIEINPDAVAIDPDRDMLALVRLYFAERRAYNEAHYCPPDYQPPHPCQYLVERPDPGIKTIAIIDFDNNAVDERERLSPLSTGLSDLMIRLLNGQTGLQIVERERTDWLLHEIGLSQQGEIDERTAIQVGKLMGAHTVLLGDYLYFNNTLTIGARLVKVETGEVLLVADEKGRLKDFSEISGKLSQTLAQEILPNVEDLQEGRVPTHDLNAMLTYAEGLSLLDRGDFAGAAAKFEATLELDPQHEPAQRRYDALRPMVASARTE